MRLWSLHPGCLDVKGLTACWREGLLARKVLSGQTKGYRNHPQLVRFKSTPDPVAYVDAYLNAVYKEAIDRGYRFDGTKINSVDSIVVPAIPVTSGQLNYEWEHLMKKLSVRDPVRYDKLKLLSNPEAHPLFYVVAGGVEDWERR